MPIVCPKKKTLNLCILFNPYARNQQAGADMAALKAACTARGLSFTLVPSQHPGYAAEWLGATTLDAYDAIVAAGGDGTLSDVVNGLMNRDPSQAKPPLGVLPMGTGNAFARELGLLPGEVGPALDIIRQGHTKRIDVGHYQTATEDAYFINIVNMCFAAEANRASRRYKALGNFGYTLGVLQTVISLQTYPITLTLDGVTFEQDTVLLAIANSRYTGTNFLIAPDARVDDGYLDVILSSVLTRRRLLRLFPTIFDGRHVDAPEVTVRRVRTLTVDAPLPLTLSPDGELAGTTPATLTCVPGALEMFWPS